MINRDGAVGGALVSHQCGPGSLSAQCHMWVEFVVGSALLPGFFSRFCGFPPCTKANISKF